MKKIVKTVLHIVLSAIMFVWLFVNIVLLFGEVDDSVLSFIVLKIGAIVSCGAQLFVAASLGHKGLINFKA